MKIKCQIKNRKASFWFSFVMLLRIFFFFSFLFCPVNTLTQKKKEGKKYIIEVFIVIISFYS